MSREVRPYSSQDLVAEPTVVQTRRGAVRWLGTDDPTRRRPLGPPSEAEERSDAGGTSLASRPAAQLLSRVLRATLTDPPSRLNADTKYRALCRLIRVGCSHELPGSLSR